MLRFTFRGGIHPDDGKAMSKDKPIREVLPKGELVYPLSQHIGAPAKAIVAKGDHVLAGQKIAEAGGFVSANIFASVSGTVKAIEARLGVAGGMQESIVIENDGLYEEVEFSPERKLADISGKEIIEIIKEAGIVGMGGAGFPTHVKYMPKDPSAIDHIIVNCAECEPYLTSDYRRMMEEPEKIVGGLQAAMKIFDGRAKGVLAVEDNKKDAAAKLREAAKGIPDIEVVELKTKYPQGAERQLIFAVTGRQINSSMLPADAGCVVNNCDTIHAIYEAVHFEKSDDDHRKCDQRTAEPACPHRYELPGTDRRGGRFYFRTGENHRRRSDDGNPADLSGCSGSQDVFCDPVHDKRRGRSLRRDSVYQLRTLCVRLSGPDHSGKTG